MADSRERVAALNGAIRDRLVAEGFVDDARVMVSETGERLGVGDRVATRRNDWSLGVANRQTWTVTAIGDDATLTLRNDRGRTRSVPGWYAQGWVELAYATTVYGAQGDTTPVGHMVMSETTSAASAYVGMTRGRHRNVAHIVAETPEEARVIWEQTFSRDRADLGVAHARVQAIDDIDRYGPNAPAKARAQANAREQARHRRRESNRRAFEPLPATSADPVRQPSRPGPGHQILTTGELSTRPTGVRLQRLESRRNPSPRPRSRGRGETFLRFRRGAGPPSR